MNTTPIPQLDYSTYSSQVFWFALCFAILYMVIRKYYTPKLEGIISDRKQHIEQNTKTANKNNMRSEEMERQYNERIKDANEAFHSAIMDISMKNKRDLSELTLKLESEKSLEIKTFSSNFILEIEKKGQETVEEIQRVVNKIFSTFLLTEIPNNDKHVMSIIKKFYEEEIQQIKTNIK